jgi:cyclopropane fatty-acyl-phospholipid synthase-like methyltransferase
MTDIAAFLDKLAPYFHLLYGDWEAAIAAQGSALARLLSSHGVGPGEAVLDAACGIGTQTIGLLKEGYSVTASDCSPVATERFGANRNDPAGAEIVRSPILNSRGPSST